MVNERRAQHTLILIVLVLFFSSLIISVSTGISPRVALIDNIFDSLQVNYNLIQFSSVTSPLFLVSRLLNAAVFPLLTVILATWFFDFINNINFRERLVLSKVNKLKDHVIVVPYNGFARVLLQELKNSGLKSVTIAENKKEMIQLYKENELAIEGDLKSMETFDIAGVDRARCIVACGKEDIQNALISITAKAAYPDVNIIVRINKEENLDRLEKAGAYKTILSESTAGKDVGEEIVKRLLSKRGMKSDNLPAP